MSDQRKQDLGLWVGPELAKLLGQAEHEIELETVSGDASFRRYFRIRHQGKTYIAVDAPIESEDSHAFVSIAQLFRQANVTTPLVLAVDYQQGFMLLQDFGDQLYLPRLLAEQTSTDITADCLYTQAIDTLIQLQSNTDGSALPAYDGDFLRAEMALFSRWFCEKYLALSLDQAEHKIIEAAFDVLADRALQQTQVAVHRDYHSRNLLILDESDFPAPQGPGVIDFQDAMCGAYTYDLVSLLRDCYVQWPQQRIRRWAMAYYQQAQAAGIIAGVAEADFICDFDLMGLQRNLKVLGIFARLYIRDNKPQYLADMPRVITYFTAVSERYSDIPEIAEFTDWFERRVLTVARPKLGL